MERDADVVVVGAGIVGCATAYYLARRGARVVVVERAAGARRAVAEELGLRAPAGARSARDAARAWRPTACGAASSASSAPTSSGCRAAISRSPPTRRGWRASRRGCRSRASTGSRRACSAARDLDAVVPGLGGGWVGGMHTPGDGHADPEKTTDAFARGGRRSRRRRCTWIARCRRDARAAGAVDGVVTERGEIRAPSVVCAAGAWSSRLAARSASPCRSAGCAARSRAPRRRPP